MIKAIGIISAAGKAERFGGVSKELLPAKDGFSLISHAYKRLQPVCDLVIVVTNKDKVRDHIKELEDVYFVEQTNQLDILGAIQSGMKKIKAERYYFTMPDTFLRDDVFIDMPLGDGFSIGLFETLKPEKFGCLVDKVVYDKSSDVPSPAQAWGVLSWNGMIQDLFFENPDLPLVLNNAIKKYGFEYWDIGEYYDMATIHDYIEYLKT